MERPPFLSLDGIDGTGKTLQARRLAAWLRERGWIVVECRDPGGTPLADDLRELLLNRKHDIAPMAEAMLFMASRAELVARTIRPALDAGSLVLSDRYLLSTVVYQGHGGNLNVDDLWTAGRIAASGIEPDLTLVLDLPVGEAQTRRGREPDRMESRQRDYHERVREGFLIEAKRQPNRIRVVNATGNIDDVHALIVAEVERELATRSRP